MKQNIIALFILGLAPLSVQAEGGVGTRGGGAATPQAFSNQGWTTYYQLKRSYPKAVPAIDLEALKQAITDAKIRFVEEKLELEGEPVDAINDPNEKWVKINTGAYAGLSDIKQKRLNLHEYFGVARIDDKNYKLSNPLVLALEGDPVVRLEDEVERTERTLHWLLVTFRQSPPTWMCYQIPELGGQVQKIIDEQAQVRKDDVDHQYLGNELGRLKFWNSNLRDLCYERVRRGWFGGKLENWRDRLGCQLTLIERDVKIVHADVLRFLGRTGESSLQVWNRYRAEGAFNGLCH